MEGENQTSAEWVYTSGGPLIFMETHLMEKWLGSDVYANGNGIPSPSDYDIACQVTDYIGVIRLRGINVLVLGDEPMQTTWVNDNRGGILLRWEWAEQEGDILVIPRVIPENVWNEDQIYFTVEKGACTLFDSAMPGHAVGSCIEVYLEPGSYSLLTARYQPNRETSAVLHKFQWVD